MVEYPEALLGCPLRAYSLSRINSVSAQAVLRGRRRFTLEDTSKVYTANVQFDFSAGQMAGWQTFWRTIGLGTDWFMLTIPSYSAVIGEGAKECHALQPFSASVLSNNRWSVSLSVEFIT